MSNFSENKFWGESQHIMLQATESELRKQLMMYSGKFEIFQKALESSNEALTEYREKLQDSNKSRVK